MKFYVLGSFYLILFTPLLAFWGDDYFVQYKTYLPFLMASITLFVIGYRHTKIVVQDSDYIAIGITFLLFLSSLLNDRVVINFPHLLGNFLFVLIWILIRKYHFPSLSNNITIAIIIMIWVHIFVAIYGWWFNKLQNTNSVFNTYLLGISHNPSVISCYLVTFLPIIMHQAQSHRLKKVSILTILFIVFVVVFNKSRVCVLGIVAMFLFFYYSELKKAKLLHNAIKYTIIATILLLSLYSLLDNTKKTSSEGKLLALKISSKIGLDNLWQGTGYRSFPSEYMMYQSRYFQEGGSNREAWLANNKYVADSELVLFWVELGTPIFCSILLIILYLVYQEYLKNKAFETPLIRSWGAWVAVLMVLLPLSNVLHFPETVNAIFVSSLFYGINVQKPIRIVIVLRRETHKFMKIVICSISVLSFLFYTLIIYDLSIWKKRVETASLQENYNVDDIKHILTHNGAFLHTNAAIFKSKGNYNEAYSYIKKTNKIQVGNMTMLLEAQILNGLNRKKDAYQKYKDAVYAVPIQVLPKYYLMKTCEEWEDTTQAVSWARAILQTPIKVESNQRSFFNKQASDFIEKYTINDSTKIFHLF